MTTLPTLTDIAADDCDARLPAEFDAERVVATYVTAQRLRELRSETPRPQLRWRTALTLWLLWTFGEED